MSAELGLPTGSKGYSQSRDAACAKYGMVSVPGVAYPKQARWEHRSFAFRGCKKFHQEQWACDMCLGDP